MIQQKVPAAQSTKKLLLSYSTIKSSNLQLFYEAVSKYHQDICKDSFSFPLLQLPRNSSPQNGRITFANK